MHRMVLVALLALTPFGSGPDQAGTYSLTATRDCRGPGIAHRTLPLGSVVRFTAPRYLAGRSYHVTRRPGWPRGLWRTSGDASVFTGPSHGVAIRNRRRGGWILTFAPNGTVVLHQQTDYGPGILHRWIDLTPEAAAAHGYPYSGFPTDRGTWRGRFLGYQVPLGLRPGRQHRRTAVGLCRWGGAGDHARVRFIVVRRGQLGRVRLGRT